MKVSVVMPVYNMERYVRQAINSVLRQTFKDYEVIIVDDGSTDRSYDICTEFTDSRIRIIQQENRGLPGARNTGVEVSRGQYIAFLDPDDMWLPKKLEKHVAHLDSHPEIGISFSYSAFINEKGDPTGLYQLPRYEGITQRHLFCSNPVGNGSNAVVRRAALDSSAKMGVGLPEAKRPFDEELQQVEDLELWNRIILLSSWEIEGIPEVLTLYRLRDSSLSRNIGVHKRYYEFALDKIRGYAPLLVAKYQYTAMAHFQWYVARIALQHRDGKQAIRHCAFALRANPMAQQLHYPLILGATMLLNVLPRRLYTACERIAMLLFGRYQRWMISKTHRSVTPSAS